MKTMNVAIISNHMNYHQLPLAEAFIERVSTFVFIACGPKPANSFKSGKTNMDSLPFVIRAYESKEQYNLAMDFVLNVADIVIFGSGNNDFVKNLNAKKKAFFYYGEHGCKTILTSLKFQISFPLKHYKASRNGSFFLCSSYYAAKEVLHSGLFKNRLFCWGYFPNGSIGKERKSYYPSIGKPVLTLLFAGRCLKLKRPKLVIDALNRFIKNGLPCKLLFLSNGPYIHDVKKYADKLGVSQYISFMDMVSPDEVSNHMMKADVFIFSSNHREGWGAVLNEAMSAGCCCLASTKAGSTGFLIQNRKNGLVFASKKQLLDCVDLLSSDTSLIGQLGLAAKSTIEKTWNANVAVNNLLSFWKKQQISNDKIEPGIRICKKHI